MDNGCEVEKILCQGKAKSLEDEEILRYLSMLRLKREKEKGMEIMRSQRRKEKEGTRETEGARKEIDRESLEP